jgi:hypothetical protein
VGNTFVYWLILSGPTIGLATWIAVSLRRKPSASHTRFSEWIFIGLLLAFLGAWRWPDFFARSGGALKSHASIGKNSTPWPADLGILRPDYVSFQVPEIEEMRARRVLKMYAPGKIAWLLDGTEREFRFEYGFIPRAYKEGDTNGAEFIVELLHAGQIRQLFRRVLDPIRVKEDQNHQFSRVILPPFQPGTQLILRLAPGEFNNNSWDWLYLCNVGFHRSTHFIKEQFPSFNRVPTSANTDLAYLYQKEGHPHFLQLSAPSSLVYELDGKESRLAFTYGFFPGAYLTGSTDGARFIVERESHGQSPETLFQRFLQPLSLSSDRGPQLLDLPLRRVKSGDRLVIRIDPGPAGNNSWDWTYLSRLTLD